MSESSIGVVRWYSISNYPLSSLPIHSPFQRQATGSKLVEPREKKTTLTNCWLQIWWLQRFDIKSPFHAITSSGTSHAPSFCLFCQHLRIMDSLCLWMKELERLSTTAVHTHFQSSRLFYEKMKIWHVLTILHGDGYDSSHVILYI